MLDFKKEQKEFYQPKTTPAIVDVPEMRFLAIDGVGDPNTGEEYAHALELLYGLSFTIKMSNKDILEYRVPPLEGFWTIFGFSVDDAVKPIDKDKFVWTSAIRQPDFISDEVVEAAKEKLAKKKPHLDVSKARLESIAEGKCVQVLHVGPYDDEPATIKKMEQFAEESGYAMDVSESRRHHEIYLSDARKTAPEKLKTIIRLPVKKE